MWKKKLEVMVMNFTLTLRQARAMRGFTQKELARRLGVHVQTYSKMEKEPEEVTIRDAKRISEILDVSYDLIFFDNSSTFGRLEEKYSTLR
jgi:transcriptional regulator with XRE-family HTH domain